MIPPRQQWCIQIDITNACPRACSNCTRLTAHAQEPFFMDLPTFERAARALAHFPTRSPADRHGRPKVVGIMGGEPLMHPLFGVFAAVICRAIPNTGHHGLWTGLDYSTRRHAAVVRALLGDTPSQRVRGRTIEGYLNYNPHRPACWHQPVLVGVQEVIRDKEAMWRLIRACPLQEQWAGAITPKGFFFCEVAASLDMIFQGPGGLPIDSRCWTHDLDQYEDQIRRWCPRCGVCLPLKPRKDEDEIDDISPGNFNRLQELGSPRIAQGGYRIFDVEGYAQQHIGDWQPLRYKR